nr:hypothetical protein [Pseudomonas entomophila]
MADPRDKATASAPPRLGEGCLARYDPEAMDETLGTAFEGAAELWRQLSSAADASASAGDGPADTETAGRLPPGRSST